MDANIEREHSFNPRKKLTVKLVQIFDILKL